jgi:hypothetical protein
VNFHNFTSLLSLAKAGIQEAKNKVDLQFGGDDNKKRSV